MYKKTVTIIWTGHISYVRGNWRNYTFIWLANDMGIELNEDKSNLEVDRKKCNTKLAIVSFSYTILKTKVA